MLIVKLKRGMTNTRTSVYFQIPSLDVVLDRIDAHERAPLLPMAPFDQVLPLGPENQEKGYDRVYVLRYGAPYDPLWVCEEMKKTGAVEFAEPYYIFNLTAAPNDPLNSGAYWLDMIHAREAWEVTHGDSTVSIGIVDTGVDWLHEDLSDNIAINPGESGLDAQGKDKRTNGKDDDNNGVIDDYHGWDFVGNPTLEQMQSGVLTPDNDPRPRLNNLPGYEGYHGTEVAGCAAARADNGKGLAGPAFHSKLIPAKCAPDSIGTNSVLAGYDGIRYAADRGARVINCSWGGPVDGGNTQAMQTVIDYAYDKGALVVAASGNGGTNNDLTPSFPANLKHVLSVGASDSKDSVAGFAEYGVSVGVWAPGVGILTTYPNNQYVSNNVDGTSFASPITAGVAALVFGRHPDWTPDQVAMQLRVTGDKLNLSSSQISPYYFRRVNAYRAVWINTSLTSGERMPGIGIESYTINGKATDTITSLTEPVAVKVVLKNYLAPASNVKIEAFPNQSLTMAAPITVTTMGTMQSVTQDIQVKINPASPVIYSEGNMQLILKVTSGTYEDYLSIPVPVNLPGWHNQLDPQQSAFTVYAGSSIATVSPTTAWAIANVNNQSPVYTRTTSGNTWASFRAVPPGNEEIYCVAALDAQKAWVGTGPDSHDAGIYRTTNSGSAWQRSSVAAITPFVNAIHFFDANNGIFIGDPLNGVWGIGRTTDGGATWTPLPSPLPAPAAEAGWNNSFTALGDTLWFGTNNSRIYRSTNRGLTWTYGATPSINSFDVAFAKGGLDGIATFNPQSTGAGSDMIAVTHDGGKSWVAARAPFTGTKPQSVTFVPGTTTAYLATQNGVYQTSDFAKTWKQMAMPQMEFSGMILDAAVDSKGNIGAYGTNIFSQIMTYREAAPPAPVDTVDTAASVPVEPSGSASGRIATLHQNMPNPFAASTTIGFDLASAANVTVVLHDALGAEVMKIAEGRMTSGAHEVAIDGAKLAPGIYFYTLVADGERLTRSMMVVR
jgi:subtilisin family serine protease/photosystem II stability/assembly factor-like uncharacterized protein